MGIAIDERIRVLVVEDEEAYRQALSSGLGREGFVVDTAVDGIEAIQRFVADRPDIVLLDLRLPGMDGIEVYRRMRDLAPVPVVMVSAVDSELDVVLGLELGAAGYVTKPFRLRELVARIQAILRRVSPPALPELDGPPSELEPDRPTVVLGSVAIDVRRHEVKRDDEAIQLSRREFDLLSLLTDPPGRVRTREELIDRLWPDRDLSDIRTLDTHMHRLRSKLEPDPSHPRYLVTVRGIGFRIDVDGGPPSHRTGPGPTPPEAGRQD